MEYIYIKLADGVVKVFGSKEEMPNDDSMFYKRKSESENWGDYLRKEWIDSLTELKWWSKQDEIKTCIKLRKENEPYETLEEYLKYDYREVTSLVYLEEIDCKFPTCTCTPSKCKERGFKVSFKETQDNQANLAFEIICIIQNDDSGNALNKIIEKFEIKRKQKNGY